MKIIIKNLKITRIKLFLAGILYHLLKIFYRNNQQNIKRQGINYQVDLNEGIDLHLFLFGNFQKHITHNKVVKIPEDAIIYDVGANSGVLSLSFAAMVPKGAVHAFEPTSYALEKFKKNIDLNPELNKRIHILQTFISSENKQHTDLKAYSSWPIKTKQTKNKIHKGVHKTTENIGSITLDTYTRKNNIQRIDLIKIDTDGHELQVLHGCTNILKNHQPTIIFELGVYVMEERNIHFNDYNILFDQYNYQLFTPKGKQITPQNYDEFIPQYGTIDIIAVPTNSFND